MKWHGLRLPSKTHINELELEKKNYYIYIYIFFRLYNSWESSDQISQLRKTSHPTSLKRRFTMQLLL